MRKLLVDLLPLICYMLIVVGFVGMVREMEERGYLTFGDPIFEATQEDFK